VTNETTHATLIEALIAAQSEFPGIPKEASGQARGGRYQYATLPAVLEAVVPSLNRHGIALIQRTAVEGESLTLHTILRHTSGEEIESVVPLPTPVSWQDWGSALTYARRYSITALAGVAPDDDDDGARAQDAPKAAARPAEDHGVCADHGVPWRRYEKAGEKGGGVHVWFSHAPLEDGGRWHQREDSWPDAGEKPSLAQKAAEIAAARVPMPAAAVATPTAALAPYGMCPQHKVPLAKGSASGKIGHMTTVGDRKVLCELPPAPSLDQQADNGWGGMPPATAENTREV